MLLKDKLPKANYERIEEEEPEEIEQKEKI